MVTYYRCAACERADLTNKTAVHVVGSDDYLCRIVRNAAGYEAKPNCLAEYTQLRTIGDRRAVLIQVEPVPEMIRQYDPGRV